MKRRQPRRFSKEFKAEAIPMDLDEGITIRRVARDLDVWEGSLGN
ncbi:MAG: transposase [Myxococcota bacterium]